MTAHSKTTDAKATGSHPEHDACSSDPILSLARQAMAKVVSDSRKAVKGQQPHEDAPSDHVVAMAKALADPDYQRAEVLVAELLDAGVGVQDLCLDHLAPAARELGTWWERDAMQFADVTMATARIQSILRTLPASRAKTSGLSANGALFAAVPGETHTLGVLMAADHFRRLGWDVGLLIGMDHGELLRAISQDDRKVIGLSCAGRHSAPALHRLVDEIRRRRPDMAIVVSGNVLNDVQTMESLPYVDGIADALEKAEWVLKDAMQNARGHGQKMSAS